MASLTAVEDFQRQTKDPLSQPYTVEFWVESPIRVSRIFRKMYFSGWVQFAAATLLVTVPTTVGADEFTYLVNASRHWVNQLGNAAYCQTVRSMRGRYGY